MKMLAPFDSRDRNRLFLGPRTDRMPIAAMAEQKLWTSPNGKTPHATLNAAMLREIGSKAGRARFKKAGRGLFTFNAGGK